MTIQRIGNELIVKIPNNADLKAIQRLLDYIQYNELTLNSKAIQNFVNQLSSQINKSWWEKNKAKLLGE